MNEASVWVKYRKKYKITTDSNHNKPLFENLPKRQFDVDAPDLAYVADMVILRFLMEFGRRVSAFG